MNTELTEAQRADIRQMARDVMADKDGLAQIDRDVIGYGKVRIDLPLRDTQMLKKHLDVLAALCNAFDLDMGASAAAELVRVWGKIDVIRAKQAAKPIHSPLPIPTGATP